MAIEFEVIDIWVGYLPSSEFFDRYLEEDYREDEEEKPISKFAADMGQRFYDHDFLESSYQETATQEIKALLQNHSFARSYLQQATNAFFGSSIPPINTIILLWNEEIENPVSVKNDEYQIYYLGRFSCDPRIRG